MEALTKMKSLIKDVEVIPVRVALNKTFKGSHYYMTHRCTIITRITTEDGVVGEIYNGDEMEEAQAQIIKMITNEMAPLIKGKNIFQVNKIWEELLPFTFDILADRKIALQALACIDSAIYDAIGKTLSIPLYQLWGGYQEKLPVMLIGGYYQEGVEYDPEAIKEDIESYKELGVAGVKFKVGGRKPEIDAKRVEIARLAAGEEFIIAVDANQGWTVMEALHFAERIKDYNIRWFEEPCHWYNDKTMMRDVRFMSGIPITGGQSEVSAAACIELMKAGSIDVCNFDASWGAGPTAWKQAAAASWALGIQMAHHEEPQVSAHLLASIPNGTYLEVFHPDRDPLFYNIIENRNPFINGYYEVPNGHGFGIELNRSYVDKHRLDK